MIKLSIYLVRNKKYSQGKFKSLSIQKVDELCSTGIFKECCNHYKVSYIIPYIKLSKYDGIFEIWFNDFETLNKIRNNFDYKKIIENISDILNLNECNCIISEEYSPVFGSEMIYSPKRIKFTTLLIRNEKINFPEFKNYHKKRHIRLFSSIPIIKRNIKKYVVSHQIEKSNCKINYDGIVEFWFDSLFSVLMVFINPKYLSKVRPDEKIFLNLRKCDFLITKEYFDFKI
jgi:hypothetical protein